jgi:demethylspheroidene O-methyltransferase
MADAYFGLYLWAMGSGRARSAAELQVLLLAAGFARVRCQRTPMPLLAGLVIGSV